MGRGVVKLVLSVGLIAATACADRPSPEVAGEPVSQNAPVNLDGWVGSYHRNFREYACNVEILEWREHYLGRVKTGGYQVSSDLLCRLEPETPDRLRLVFTHDGADPGMQNSDYEPGQIVVTLLRTPGGVQIEPGALVPREEPEPPRPRKIADLPLLDHLDPADFIGVQEVSGRLDRLLGNDRGRFDRAVVFRLPGSRDGDLLLLEGGEPHSGPRTAGLAYDTRHDVITAFIADPECRERLDVWSESWRQVGPKTLDWIQKEGGPALPMRRHRP